MIADRVSLRSASFRLNEVCCHNQRPIQTAITAAASSRPRYTDVALGHSIRTRVTTHRVCSQRAAVPVMTLTPDFSCAPISHCT